MKKKPDRKKQTPDKPPPPERSYAFIQPGVWLSIYDLAIVMHRTVRWIRRHVRDTGNVPCTAMGDTDYFHTDDVIAFLAERKRYHGGKQGEPETPIRGRRRSAA